jgi:hypothetical protein
MHNQDDKIGSVIIAGSGEEVTVQEAMKREAERIEFCKTIKSDLRYTTEELKEYLKFSERVVKEV